MAIKNNQNVNYHMAWIEKDPISDLPFLSPIDRDQHADINAAVDGMKTASKENFLIDRYDSCLRQTLSDHIDIFRISFSSGPGDT